MIRIPTIWAAKRPKQSPPPDDGGRVSPLCRAGAGACVGGPVTATVCVLAKALRNTRFVKSAAPDPQQNQALQPSFPRASDGEVSKGTIDGRSTVQPHQRTRC